MDQVPASSMNPYKAHSCIWLPVLKLMCLLLHFGPRHTQPGVEQLPAAQRVAAAAAHTG